MKNDKPINQEPDQLAEYLRELVAVIYTATPSDWQQRINECPGDRSDIDRELLRRVSANDVHKTLFRDKNITKETRKKMFSGLVKFAHSHDMAPPPTILKTATIVNASENYENTPYAVVRPKYKIRDVVAEGIVEWPKDEAGLASIRQRFEQADDLTLHTVRWAVEVRQRQVAEHKTRIIPQSLKDKRAQADDSIQFKRKYRA